ncbi:Nicotinamide-nucleotide amidohydrolase PncC [wastewater metagenome]|uniref:Nicotinamide-nucleotide amidohydrolase PncC n=2 Tax=unclassified sequences TaxID=12908 RepID=A0A5B8RES5_9ZZZZ|nr:MULTISPECIES: CinA family protein [Arhodomonas]MCS4503694.1 CinA family protein [Arhodomonas aquaeolei]QEA07121.1 nicotinamide-nucleotide amidohydrolase PncC [uncultured organism]
MTGIDGDGPGIGVDDAGLDDRARRLGAALAAHGWLVSAAESCTGGWIGKVLTDIPGSSAWFERGFIVYGNAAKRDLLGVPAATLEADGAVSEATAAAMVRGVLTVSDAALAVAVTGVAGPDGGTPERPVGTVWFAWGRRGGGVQCRCHRFDGDREAVRRQSVAVALDGLIEATGA